MTTTLEWPDAVDSRTNHYVRRWMRHFPLIRATCIESWLEGLSHATLPTLLKTLSPVERDLLVEERWRRESGRPSIDPCQFDELVLSLEELVLAAQDASEPGSTFLRLGSRAPIDSQLARKAELQVDGGPEALEVLLDSPRLFDDLCLFQECGYSTSLIVRPWLRLPRWCELRAFIRGRRLVGLSQRILDGGPLHGLAQRADALEEAILRRCDELRQAWPLDELVVDFACPDGQAWVVDLHPWLPWTSGGLFSWEEDTFSEYSFRYLR